MKNKLVQFARTSALACVGAALFASTALAAEMNVPQARFGQIDHVFLIMMENEAQSDILGNVNAPFINAYAQFANQATSYFAVGHPSAPNYLEIVGGSNFNLKSDYWPAWSNGGCVDNQPGSTGCSNALPPIPGLGMDNAVVATATSSTDCNGQISTSPPVATNNCALRNYPATSYVGKSIADQLVAKRMTWKTYQESLPTTLPNAIGVNYSDGTFSNLSPTSAFVGSPAQVQKLYAVKHNPFAYFLNIQQGANPALSFDRVQDFTGPKGLWADLANPETAPNFSMIVPNQCHDMHGAGGGAAWCTNGALTVQAGDAALKQIVEGIKASPTWRRGRNVIVVLWDENDYENAANKVVFLTETNFAPNGVVSNTPYDHFSLLRTLEAGFGLPCLNHACDSTSLVMNELFGFRAGHDHDHDND